MRVPVHRALSALAAPNGWKEHTALHRKHFSSATDSLRCPKKEQFIKRIRRIKLSTSSVEIPEAMEKDSSPSGTHLIGLYC